jgi:hypothetical protein
MICLGAKKSAELLKTDPVAKHSVGAETHSRYIW